MNVEFSIQQAVVSFSAHFDFSSTPQLTVNVEVSSSGIRPIVPDFFK